MAEPLSILLSGAIGLAVGVGAMWLRQSALFSVTETETTELRPVALPAAATGGADALVLLDVDGLSQMNKTYGPDVGDRLLDRLADVVRRSVPPGSAQERLDGGRFVLWLANHDAGAAMELAEKLRLRVIRSSVELASGERVARSISAGVVQLSGSEGRARALMAAETAMARAKRLGGDRIALATGPAQPAGPSAEEVQEAIRSGALGYHVQPIFDLRTGKPFAVEALLRWTRADGTIMGPNDFLHRLDILAEDAAALMVDLALDAARPFTSAAKPLLVSFNVAAGALDDTGSQSSDWLGKLLDRLPADRVMLELLESSVIANPIAARQAVKAAQSKGTTIALDDFGAGLSNIDRLLELNPDVIKLDRSLIADLGESDRTEAILRAMIDVSRRFGIRLIAEGLETPADAEILRSFGVPLGQGYHLGRPRPVEYWARRLL